MRSHIGSWCYCNKGPCGVDYNYTYDEPEQKPEEFKKKLIKGVAKGAVIGAALGVNCLIAHVACIITAFVHNH